MKLVELKYLGPLLAQAPSKHMRRPSDVFLWSNASVKFAKVRCHQIHSPEESPQNVGPHRHPRLPWLRGKRRLMVTEHAVGAAGRGAWGAVAISGQFPAPF